MAAILAAKVTADHLSHSFFHVSLEKKCMPYIDEEIDSLTSMERHSVSRIMNSPVISITQRPSISSLKEILVCWHL